MAYNRDSVVKSLDSADSADSSLLTGRRSKRLLTAGKEDMLTEIDSLHEEVEQANARLRCATEEVQQLRKRVDEQDDGHFNYVRRSPTARNAFGDLATEAEVRWSFFVTEKSRLQSEKGWRQALKDSKKMLEEQLSDAHAQTMARDMELTTVRTQCCDGAKELEKEKKMVMELKAMVTDLQTTLASEHLLLAQANEKNCQLQEELSALQYTKESDKMTFARNDKRFVTCDLASQLNFDYEDSDEEDEQGDGIDGFQEQQEESGNPRNSVRPSIQRREDHARQSGRSSIQQQQEEQLHAPPTLRNSSVQHNEDGLHDGLRASEAARRGLEAQVAELQRRLQQAEHQVPSAQLQREPVKRSVGFAICEQCEVLREELAKVSKAQDDARLETRDTQRRFDASEDQRQELKAQMSEMQRRAQLAEKEFRAWQQRISTPWWSRIACHCAEKRPSHDHQPIVVAAVSAKQITPLVEEDQLELNRPPRAAVHMEPAKNVGASWLARPLG